MLHQAFTVKTVPTKPIDGQKTGTSGLRKKTKVFTGENYLANWYIAVCTVLAVIASAALLRQPDKH